MVVYNRNRGLLDHYKYQKANYESNLRKDYTLDNCKEDVFGNGCISIYKVRYRDNCRLKYVRR